MTCFTADGCPQKLDGLTEHLLALVARLSGRCSLALFDKAQLFCQVDCPECAFELAPILCGLPLVEDEPPSARNGHPLACQGECIIGHIQRFVGLAFLLVRRIIGSPRNEGVVGACKVIEGSFYHPMW